MSAVVMRHRSLTQPPGWPDVGQVPLKLLVRMGPRPRVSIMVQSVVIKGGRPIRETIVPLINPIKTPIPIVKRTTHPVLQPLIRIR